MRLALVFTCLLACFSAPFAPAAHAALGGDAASVQADAQKLGAARTVAQYPAYSRHEIKLARLRLHEFTNSPGQVFAVAWQGKSHPDLSSLLGANLGEFQQALGKARRGHPHGGAIVVDTEHLHIEMGGRMMSLYGAVWLKDQLPEGMDPHEIH